MFMSIIVMILQSKFSKFLVVRALPIAAGTWFRFPAAPLGERSKKKNLRKFGHMSKLGVPYLPLAKYGQR